MRKHVFSIVSVLGGAVVVACGAVDPYGDRPSTDTSAVNPASSTGAAACSAAIPGQDPSTLTICTGTKGTKGRCVPTSSLGSFSATFEQATCADASQACVPDEVIKDGSKLNLKTCTAVLNAEGRCFWPLAKDIVTNYDLLKGATKDQCDPDQVCAPCINPLNKQPTGVCTLGASAGSCDSTPASAAPAGGAGGPAGGTCPQIDPDVPTDSFTAEDCGSDMLCVDTALVGAQASLLKPCAKGVCAPKKSVERGGNYVPPTCVSTANAEGRCLNIGIPMINVQKDILPQEKCDADERCAPCFDPRDGKATGACSSATCDAPKQPPVTFAQCCSGGGRCVPTSAVPASSQSMLSADSCTGATPLCAPNELVGVGGAPKACSAGLGLITGICVSACAISIPGASLLQGDCIDGDMCAPCSQMPPGTPGCTP